jgi:hypothetical protein
MKQGGRESGEVVVTSDIEEFQIFHDSDKWRYLSIKRISTQVEVPETFKVH